MAIVKCQECKARFEAKRKDAKWCLKCKEGKIKERSWSFEKRKTKQCIDCGKPIYRRSIRCHLCDNKSRVESNKGANNPNWKGGRTQTTDGYITIKAKRPGKKSPNQLEHIVVWEEANGIIPQGWVIHHLNGVRDDNRLENLFAMPRKRHSPKLVFKPYEERIKHLEAKLDEHKA